MYEVQVFASVESATSVTGVEVVNLNMESIDLADINTALEEAAIEVWGLTC